jgi:hypothetical protein
MCGIVCCRTGRMERHTELSDSARNPRPSAIKHAVSSFVIWSGSCVCHVIHGSSVCKITKLISACKACLSKIINDTESAKKSKL